MRMKKLESYSRFPEENRVPLLALPFPSSSPTEEEEEEEEEDDDDDEDEDEGEKMMNLKRDLEKIIIYPISYYSRRSLT